MDDSVKSQREEIAMKVSNKNFAIEVEGMKAACPLGEVVGKQMIDEKRIPVISCEGGCFRGEIARVAAHMVAKEEPYSRGCHGEMFTAPHTAMAEWARNANKVVVIDGCFMRCHGRIMKNIVGDQNVIQFDALPLYNKDRKYSDTMIVDEVPEAERKDLARQVADKVLASLRDGTQCDSTPQYSCGCERT
ncbi:MAG: putative zinc-binding protein [Candidatus Deferrimicrobiaceae bacterium]